MLNNTNEYPSLYVDFFHYFNIEKDYFECHEVLEELWLETGREPFYQGLLQVAVGLYHFQNENINGAIKMMVAASEKLSKYPEPIYMGIHLQNLKQHTEQCLQQIQSNKPFSPFYIQIEDPKLQELIENRR
jgi:uncharacterized protein